MNAGMPDAIAAALRVAVEGLLPEAKATAKYGGIIYHHAADSPENGICGVFAYKAHVSLVFPRGSELDDPGGLLQGKGKARRHLKFTNMAEIEAQHVADFITAAAQLSAPL